MHERPKIKFWALGILTASAQNFCREGSEHRSRALARKKTLWYLKKQSLFFTSRIKKENQDKSDGLIIQNGLNTIPYYPIIVSPAGQNRS